jgi:O-antigen ligase
MLFVGIVGALVLLRSPSLGLLILTVGGMLIPYVGPAGLNASLALVALMLALWIGDMVIVRQRVEFTSSRTIWPLLALVVVALLSFIAGQFSWFSFARNAPLDAQAGGLAIFVLSAGAFVLVAHQIKDLRWLQAMVWVLLAFGTLFLAGRAIPFIRPLTTSIIQPHAVGGVFYAWFPALAFGQALFNRDLRPIWRIALLAMTALCLYVGLFLFFNWKSGWVPPLVAVAILAYLRSWRVGLTLGLLAVVPVLVIMLPELLASDSYSVSTRLDAWIIMGEIIKVNPILGLGFGNYYWYTPLFRIRGWTVTFNSHNNYVDIVAQTGLAGLACFVWFFWEVGRLGWRLRERVPDGFAKAYVNSALAGLAATLVAAMLGDWVLSFVYNIGLAGFRTGVLAWMFLGGLVAIEHIYKDYQSGPETGMGRASK